MHKGSPKVWYGVPESNADKFESVMRDSMPALFERQPDALMQLQTILSPTKLMANNVKVYRAVQYPGHFVLTFPRSYHSGFSTGFNVAEAMNFGAADWIEKGLACVDVYRGYRHTAAFSMHEILIGCVHDDMALSACKHVRKQLLLVIQEEEIARNALIKAGVAFIECKDLPSRRTAEAKVQEQCHLCKFDLYLSSVVCRCPECKGHPVCQRHAMSCGAASHFKSCRCRYSIVELRSLLEIIDRVEAKGIEIISNRRLLTPYEESSVAGVMSAQLVGYDEITKDEAKLKLPSPVPLASISPELNQVSQASAEKRSLDSIEVSKPLKRPRPWYPPDESDTDSDDFDIDSRREHNSVSEKEERVEKVNNTDGASEASSHRSRITVNCKRQNHALDCMCHKHKSYENKGLAVALLASSTFKLHPPELLIEGQGTSLPPPLPSVERRPSR